jgi:hypothetical protein
MKSSSTEHRTSRQSQPRRLQPVAWRAQRRCNQAATAASTGQLSASHGWDSTPCSLLVIKNPLVQACVKMRRIRRGFSGESTVFSDRLYQQRHLAKAKEPKRMIRLYGLPFTFRYESIWIVDRLDWCTMTRAGWCQPP